MVLNLAHALLARNISRVNYPKLANWQSSKSHNFNLSLRQYYPPAEVNTVLQNSQLKNYFALSLKLGTCEERFRMRRFIIYRIFSLKKSFVIIIQSISIEFIVPTFDTKVTEYLCSGWVFFSSDKFRLFN